MKRQIIVGIVTMFLLSVAYFPLMVSYAEDNNSTALSVILYDTNQYGAGTGTELTTSGATINDWQYDTSKFLQINPNVPDDGNIYSITVKMPKEFYAVTNSVSAPVGYSSATFTKNSPITATNYYSSTKTYNLNNYSGTFKYTLESGVTSGTIQMEIQYDKVLWDKLASSLLTSNSDIPIEVILTNETTGEVIESKKVSSAYSGSAYIYGNLSARYIVGSNTYTSSISILTTDLINHNNYIPTSNSSAVYNYYDRISYKITLPKYTEGGVTYYPDLNLTSINNSNFKPTVNASDLANGILILDYNNVYFSSSHILYSLKMSFPAALQSSSNTTFLFQAGSVELNVSDKNGTMKFLKRGTMPAITYKTQADENVTFPKIDKSVTIADRPSEAISLLGGFNLKNLGSADSDAKTFKLVFDTTNTNLIKVTTYRLPFDFTTSPITIKYTLVDDNGDSVCINDVCEWTYDVTNPKKHSSNQGFTFYRGLLPANQRSYYFKTLEYTLNSIPAATYLYGSSGSNSYTSGGNFFGYISSNGVSGNKIKTTNTMTPAFGTPVTNTSTTTLTNTNTTAFDVRTPAVNKTSIAAGDNVTVTGTVKVSNYPYGYNTWLKSIVVGFILPEGVTINEQSVYAYTKSINNKYEPTSITNTTLQNGNILWRIYFDPSIVIGYANEKTSALTNGDAFNFSMQLDTASNMNQQTIVLKDSLFAGSTTQSNAAGGSWSYGKQVDTYDINNNGSTTDYIGRINATNTTSFEITPQRATFEIDDSVDILKNGISIDSGKETSINTSSEVINYKLTLDCTNGGTVENFSYYIPIPKKNYSEDSYLITDTTDFFDTVLSNNVTVTGSAIYDIYYTLDNVNYTNKDSNTITWYSESEFTNNNLNYNDVTMIKLLPNVSIIPNGSSTIVNVPLIYSGNNYSVEAGREISFQGAGYFLFMLNGRESSGNFSTDGVKVSIKYEKVLDEFSFMVTKDDSIAVKSYETNDIPLFVKSQNYKITKVEANGFTLRSKSYMATNDEMEPVLANTNFAITLSLNNGTEYEIMDSANTTPISIGSVNESSLTNLKFKIYNASTIGALYLDARELTVTLTGDNGVTIKQKMIINSTPSSASSPELSIITGKSYNTFDDKNNEVTISKDSAFTTQFVVSYVPMNYGNKSFVFNSNLPVGATITMLDIVDNSIPNYYYYKVNSEVSSILLTDFIQMGTNNHYEYLTGSIEKEEIMLLVIDFSRCENYLSNGSYNVYLSFVGNSIVEDFESSKLTYIIRDRRTFSVSTNSEAYFNDNVTINYSAVASTGTESNYIGRKLAFILKAPNTLPMDTYIEIGSTKYYLNDENEFILPFIDVLSTSGSLTFKMKSGLLPKVASNYLFNCSLWISSTSVSELPKAGEKIKEFTITFKNKGVIAPSIKINSMGTRLIYSNEVNKNNTLSYQFNCDSSVVTTIELQQKIGSAYQKVTNYLSRVNGITQSDMGVYTITSSNGNNTVNFNLSSSTAVGTYRFIIRIKDTNGNEILSVPYNFVVVTE